MGGFKRRVLSFKFSCSSFVVKPKCVQYTAKGMLNSFGGDCVLCVVYMVMYSVSSGTSSDNSVCRESCDQASEVSRSR